MRSSISFLVQSYLEHLESGGDQSPEEFIESRSGDREALPVLHIISDLRNDKQDTGVLGEQLGHYRILRELGAGAQGTVHLAEDVRLGRHVALKVLPPQPSADGEYYLRFQREAEAASRLDHPGICTVYEAGVERGFPFIAMRYVEGETLRDRIRAQPHLSTVTASRSRTEGRSEVLERAGLIERVARALHAAHEKGLVHRDIKPGNIMITTEGEPVLCDFGLVREEHSDGKSLTRTGDLRGTPAYMSPEQIRGAKHELDRRTDVYSLGLVLYEYLTGRSPIDAQSWSDLYTQILTVDAPDPRRFNPAIPKDLRVVLQTAMDKDPQRRYATAHHFAEDLRRVRELKPIRARPAGKILRLRRWAQRHPAKAVAIALSGLVLFGGPLGFGLQRHRAALRLRAEKDRAERQRSLAEWRAYVANIAAADASLKSYDVGEARRRLDACDGNLRGWEWRFLKRRLDSSVTVLESGAGAVGAVAFSPDGKRVVGGAQDGKIRIWEVASGRLLRTLERHRTNPAKLAFSPDGRLVASASWDRTARIWDAETGEPLHVLKGHSSGVRSIVFSRGGRKLISGSADRTLRVWDVASGACDRVIEGHKGEVWDLALTTDGNGILSVGRQGREVLVHDWRSGRLLRRLADFEGEPWRLAMASTGWAALGGFGDRTVRVLDETGAERMVLRGHGGTVTALAFTADGRRILTGSGDGTLRLWDVARGDPVWIQLGHAGAIHGLAIGPDGSCCATAGQDGTLRVWEIEPRTAAHVFSRTGENGTAVAISPDGSNVAVTNWASVVRVREMSSADIVANLHGHLGRVVDAAYSRDGADLATVSTHGWVRLWKTGSWEQTHALHHGGDTKSAAWSPDGTRVVSGGSNRTLKVWNPRTGELVEELRCGEFIRRVEFSPSGDLIALAGDGSVQLWDPGSLERVAVLQGHAKRCTSVSFHPDGRTLVSASRDGTLRIWDVASGRCLRVLAGHSGPLTYATYDPTGTRILSCCEDGTMRIWAARTGEMLLILEGHTSIVSHAQFSADARRILSAGFDGTVRLWETSLPADYYDACRKRRELRRRAGPIVESLFGELEFSLDVIDRLRVDTDMPPDVREQALRMARGREEAPYDLVRQAWEVVKAPDHTADEYAHALRRVKMAFRIYPEFPHFWTQLGAAYYRVGAYSEALDALGKGGTPPANIAFRALARAGLGEKERYRALANRLEAQMKDRRRRDRQDLIALRDEVRRASPR